MEDCGWDPLQESRELAFPSLGRTRMVFSTQGDEAVLRFYDTVRARLPPLSGGTGPQVFHSSGHRFRDDAH
jgi:hypothetical protein